MEYFAEVTALAALAVTAVHQILKLNVVPVYFANKYPLVTNILLSVAASVFVTWQKLIELNGWQAWLAYVGAISVLSAVTYNMTLKNSESVQAASSDGK